MAIRFETRHAETKQKVLDFLEEWNDSSEEIVVKTSGSTGKPKEIRLRKEYMIASAKATCKFLDLKKGNTALLCLSMDTIGGRMMVVRSLVWDLELIVSDVSSNPLSGINEKIDFAAMVPMQAQKSLNENSTGLSTIDKLIIGGGPVSEQLIDHIQDLSTKVYHTFGMTETISHIALRSLNHPLEDNFVCLPNAIVGSLGGSLVITAPEIGVFQLQTNDAVKLLSPSSFRWLGRTDFVINSGGVKLHPEGIEARLVQLIPFPFFLCSEPDELLGEKLILMIESKEKLNIDKKILKSLLWKHSIPKEIRYISKFDYTDSGKINRLTSKELPNVAHQVL